MLVRLRSRAVLRAIDVRKDLRRFGSLRLDRGGRGSAPTLLEGAVLLSRMVRTFVPGSDELGKRLRRHAIALKREFNGRSLPTCARLLAERLHDEAGLVGQGKGGAGASVLDLDHVLVDSVLSKGTGVPVSLSLIYLLVARWAGLSVAGVAMPDHFLVRLHGVRPVLVDPFHAGRTITKADARATCAPMAIRKCVIICATSATAKFSFITCARCVAPRPSGQRPRRGIR